MKKNIMSDITELAEEEIVHVTIGDDLAVLIWDHLNEVALNCESVDFRRTVIKSRNRLEKAMKKAGIGVPKSSHGRAK